MDIRFNTVIQGLTNVHCSQWSHCSDPFSSFPPLSLFCTHSFSELIRGNACSTHYITIHWAGDWYSEIQLAVWNRVSRTHTNVQMWVIGALFQTHHTTHTHPHVARTFCRANNSVCSCFSGHKKTLHTAPQHKTCSSPGLVVLTQVSFALVPWMLTNTAPLWWISQSPDITIK